MRHCAFCGALMEGPGLPYPGDERLREPAEPKRVHWNCAREIERIAESRTIEMERNARQVEKGS